MSQGWEAPDGSRSVVFARGVPSAIRARTLEAFHSVPKRGAEVGGLLFGRVLRKKPLLARITGFEEVPCLHRFGPSYVLSEEDVAGLEAALERERPDPVIGFARSFSGREMLLDEADRNLFNHYFSDEGSIFLLLQPRAPANCLATFLFPEGGEVGWEPQYPAFDFNEARLTGEGANAEPAAPKLPVPAVEPSKPPSVVPVEPPMEVPAEAPAAAVVESPAGPVAAIEPERGGRPLFGAEPVRRELPPRPPRRVEEPRRKRSFLLPLVGWIAACLAAAGIFELWTLARAPRWTPLGMNAQVAPGAIHLDWNSGLRPVRDAARGVLTIEDGSAERRVTLSADQIRAGAYDYRPASKDVLFRLELSGSGLESAGDSLRVVTAPAVAEAAAAPAKPAPATTADRATNPDHGTDGESADLRPANVAVLPEALREIHPDIPAGIRARIHERVVVPVEVKVAANGRVSSASAHGSGDGLYQYLADRAAKAAREWRFSPAKAKNGRPVPATRTVYFVFRAEGS